jgi:colicin import membrane protein
VDTAHSASLGYAEEAQRAIRPNISWPGETQDLETVVAVRCAPTGTLLSATITRSSGNCRRSDMTIAMPTPPDAADS